MLQPVLWSIAVRVGGQSKRMGQDKSLQSFHGKPMLHHVLNTLRHLKLPITLIVNQLEKYTNDDLLTFPNLTPNLGALGRVYTAIMCSYTLCVACVIPYLPPQLSHNLFLQESSSERFYGIAFRVVLPA